MSTFWVVKKNIFDKKTKQFFCWNKIIDYDVSHNTVIFIVYLCLNCVYRRLIHSYSRLHYGQHKELLLETHTCNNILKLSLCIILQTSIRSVLCMFLKYGI